MSGSQAGSDTLIQKLTAREIADELAGLIAAGDYAAGVQLHFGELAELYGVKKPTIKRAVALLRDRGLVVDAQGRGVFVREDHPE